MEIIIGVGITLIGVIVSLALALWVEWLREPKLEITIAPVFEHTLSNIRYKVLRLIVRNVEFDETRPEVFIKYLPYKLRYRNIAKNCSGKLVFHQTKTQKEMSVPIRFSQSKQPILNRHIIQKDMATNQLVEWGYIIDIFEDSLTQAESRIDITMSETVNADIAIRYENELDCYIFSNLSYQYDRFKNPDWKITTGYFDFSIQILSNGLILAEKDFRLENLDFENEFRILELD